MCLSYMTQVAAKSKLVTFNMKVTVKVTKSLTLGSLGRVILRKAHLKYEPGLVPTVYREFFVWV